MSLIDEYEKNKPKIKPRVELPRNGKTITEFAKEISQYFKNNELVYYKPNEDQIIEIKTYYDKMLRRTITGFQLVEPKRMINIIETIVETYIQIYTAQTGFVEKTKTITEQNVKILMNNDHFINELSNVNRFFNYPMPFINQENKLIFPKKGYDERFQAYFTEDTPQIEIMTIEEAKKIINEILQEFCFKEPIDKTIAIAYMITPACRGLYKTITNRTPIFLIKANRERAGKDYLAGVIGILYEGRAIDDPPITSGDRQQNQEELRKRLTTAIKQGRRRIHSANNKGYINNAVLEQFTTSETWRDRELGHNKELVLENEIDISISANVGLTYTPDFWHRSRAINLFFSEEDPNKREFKNPDLWGYVRENRGKILSAIFTLIKTWVDAEMPNQNQLFTSFKEWARVVGGIMTYHDLGDPCITLEDDAVGGDRETIDMKSFFEYMYKKTEGKEELTVSKLRDYAIESQNEYDIFGKWDFNERKYQTRFGLNIQKYIGRVFSGIKLIVINPEQRSSRRSYKFIKDADFGNVGNVGNTYTLSNYGDEKYIDKGENVKKVTRLPKNDENKNDEKEESDVLLKKNVFNFVNLEKKRGNDLIPITDVINYFKSDKISENEVEIIIKELIDKGELFSPRIGHIGILD